MNSFEQGFLKRQQIPHPLLRTIRLLGEFKGRENLFKEQSPQVLAALRQVALIQSTESSNRIEGVEAPPERIRQLVAEKTSPRNRSEQEIAGYRDVLATIHANHPNIHFNLDTVLSFHRDLYRFVPQTGGAWKTVDNTIVDVEPNGQRRIRFRTVPAADTPSAMKALHKLFEESWEQGEIDPLLLIPAYVLDFLCIHPFPDGNGRMARLLSLFLLYRANYEVGRYISLEKIVEDHKQGYYDSLYHSSQGWHEAEHPILPWWEFFLGVMLLGAYREFESRVGTLTEKHGAKREMIIEIIERFTGEFRVADIERACPGVSRPTINRALREMRDNGKITCIKKGRNATWHRISS